MAIDLDKVVYDKRIIKGSNRNEILDGNTLDCSVGIDGNFVVGMGVLLISILKNNPNRNLNFHIFTDKSIDSELDNFNKVAAEYVNVMIIIHYLDEKFFENLPAEFIWTTAIYYRFLVPIEANKMGISKIWYLDSDELCVGEIKDFVIDGSIPLAGISYPPTPEENKKRLQRISGREDIVDIQSAGIYINVDAWLKNRISEKCIDSLRNDDLRDYKYFDGDALIKAVDNNVLPMELKYNYCYNLTSDAHEIPKDTIFVHFAGTAKPWKAWAQDNKQTKLWNSYKTMSPWKNYPLDMPTNYKQAKFMLRYMKRIGKTSGTLEWYTKYVWWKILGRKKI